MRQFYFMIVVWGERYRAFFVDYCLPSLLAPQNLPLLSASDGHKFLIATTATDWNALKQLPIMGRLAKYATPEWIEIGFPERADVVSRCRHMSLGHRLLCDAALRDRALGCFIAPDAVYSDGLIALIVKHATLGTPAVLLPTITYAEGDLFEDFGRSKLFEVGSESRPSHDVIALKPRTMVRFAVRSLFYNILSHEWCAADFVKWPAMFMWVVPGGRGLLMHCSYFWYILIDFADIERYESRSFDQASIENSWLSDNFRDPGRAYVIQDSDEAMVLSWTAAPVPLPARQPHWYLSLPLWGSLCKAFWVRRMWQCHKDLGDVHKAYDLRFPLRHHSVDLDETWRRTEAYSGSVMFWVFGDTFSEYATTPTRRMIAPLLWVFWTLAIKLVAPCTVTTARMKLLASALSGDREAIARIRSRIGLLLGGRLRM